MRVSQSPNISYSPLHSTSTHYEISSAYYKSIRYFSRIFKFDQMDFQFAFWQMIYLFTAPQKLTKIFRARKNFKSQYARDDPAFLVLFAGALCITSIAFSLVLRLNFFQFLVFLLLSVFMDCILFGALIATVFWFLTNKFLKPKSELQDVEWGFAFDIHLNALFPPLIILHFLQLILYDDVLLNWVVSVLLGNTFWLVAAIYYMYITFLGYNSLQILQRTRVFLIPIPWFVLLYICSVFYMVNIPQILFEFYDQRIFWR